MIMKSLIGTSLVILGAIALVTTGAAMEAGPATEIATTPHSVADSKTGASMGVGGTANEGNETNDRHRFRVTESEGAGLAFVINGTKRKRLTLVRGVTYVFNVSTPGHPFHISRDSDGGDYSGIYNKGVNVTDPVQGKNATETGTLTFTVPKDAPNTLYYQCGVHLDMGAQITIASGLSITANTTTVQINDTVQFTVTRTDTGNLTNATVNIGTTTLTTGDDGTIAYTFTSQGTFTATANKTNTDTAFVADSVRITVRKLPIVCVGCGTPTDPDDDGDVEDLNGNGQTDFDDVVAYFQHMDDPTLTDHVSVYDFNKNDRIDYDDIITLFKEL